MNKRVIRKTALAVFKDGKVMMARSKKNQDAFYSLGGKIEEGESEIESLQREVREETATTVRPGSIKFLHEFEDQAHGKSGTFINIRLYTGELVGTPQPSSEIAELRYFDSRIEEKHLTPISKQIFEWLHDKNYIS